MLGIRLFSVSVFALCASAQIQTIPSNVSTGFIRLPQIGIQALTFAPPTKQVSFFYTPNGLVAYDGDVIFGTIEEFNRALVNITYNSLSNATAPSKRALEGRHPHYRTPVALSERSNSIFPGSSGIWPDSKIFYHYFDDETEALLSQSVQPAIDAWTDAVPCLRFEKLPNSNEALSGVVNILANNPNAGVCLASIGYAPYSRWMELDTGVGGCGVAEVIHEWGHILGLVHEQKRPDSYKYDRFVCKNLVDYPFGLSEIEADAQCCGVAPDYSCCGWACQFTPDFGYYNEQDPVPENGGAFDLNSIMLYRNDAFAKPGFLTLLDGPNTFVNPQQLSTGDTNRIKELYCSDPKPPADCPASCDPSPGLNQCSFPTAQSCVFPSPSTLNPRAACACRAGFKATTASIPDTDTTKQWRLPADEGNFRVWVAEGVECNTPCEYTTGTNYCSEVPELPADCLHN